MGQDYLRYHPNSPFRTLSPAHCLSAKRSCCNVQPRRPYSAWNIVRRRKLLLLRPETTPTFQFALAGPFRKAYAPRSHHMHGSLKRIGRPYYSCSTVYVLFMYIVILPHKSHFVKGYWNFFYRKRRNRQISKKLLDKTTIIC